MMSRPSSLLAALAAALLVSAGTASAQPDGGSPSTPVPAPAPEAAASAPTPPADAGSARDALKKKAGDVDQTSTLKETLTATDKSYSLLKAGKLQTTYDLTYQYIGTQTLAVNFTQGALTEFQLENVRSHTITNSVEVDYGVLDNLTGTLTLPLVSKYVQTDNFTGLTNAPGDIMLGFRMQPFALKRDSSTLSVTGSLRLPTGRSPFTTVREHDLATGQGYTSATVGVNVSKIVDPAALFGSVNLTLADAANHIKGYNDGSGNSLVGVKPGPSIGVGGGYAYSLSYDLSTTQSFQVNYSFPSRLVFDKLPARHSNSQVSAIASFGLGVRVSPKTTLNFSLGIGLTNDSPDFQLDLNMPLNFGSIL